jgi:hypothetical protein
MAAILSMLRKNTASITSGKSLNNAPMLNHPGLKRMIFRLLMISSLMKRHVDDTDHNKNDTHRRKIGIRIIVGIK